MKLILRTNKEHYLNSYCLTPADVWANNEYNDLDESSISLSKDPNSASSLDADWKLMANYLFNLIVWPFCMCQPQWTFEPNFEATRL